MKGNALNPAFKRHHSNTNLKIAYNSHRLNELINTFNTISNLLFNVMEQFKAGSIQIISLNFFYTHPKGLWQVN